MTTCPNCDTPFSLTDPRPCQWCDLAHRQLVERLNGHDDGAASFGSIASWALYGKQVEPEAVWWIG